MSREVEATATPRPWRVGEDGSYYDVKGASIVYDALVGNTTIEVPVVAPDASLTPQDAALIVHAVNAHDALVEATRVAALELTQLNKPGSPLGSIRDGLYTALKLAEETK